MEMPTLDFELTTPSGERGWIGTWYAHESDESMVSLRTPFESRPVDETRIFISTSAPNGITRRWTMKLEGQLKPRARDCTFEFGLTASGRAKVDTPFPTVVYAILTRSPSSSLSTASWSLINGRVSVVGTRSSIAARKRRRVGSTLKRASSTTFSLNFATSGLLQMVTRTRRFKTATLVSVLAVQKSKILM
jgi:hypothetical protein